MTETATQFAARVLGLADCPPPVPKRGARYGAALRCWLCGGETGGVGWPQAAVIAPTFTQHNLARCGDSDAVCQSCAAMIRAETFQAFVTGRGLPIKLWSQCGWHSYSHLILEDGTYRAPGRDEMRAVVLAPPAGAWLLGINASGQKHTIFRATVARSRTLYPVQLDETTIWCRAADVAACFDAFEALAALGFSKDSILSGSYHHGQMLKVGIARWSAAEERIAPWREKAPDLMALAHMVAYGPAKFPPPEPAERPATTPAAETRAAPPPRSTKPTQPAQGDLFG